MRHSLEQKYPDGWRVTSDLVYDGMLDFETVYRVYKWSYWTKKRFLRGDTKHEGWVNVYTSRYEDEAWQWMTDTIRAQNRKED